MNEGRPQNGWGSDTNIRAMRWTSIARSGREAAQTYLGLSASQVRLSLQSGKTLAEIASAEGKSVTGLDSAIKTALTDSVNADSKLSASQKASIIANLRSFVDSIATCTWNAPAGGWHARPDGPMTGRGW